MIEKYTWRETFIFEGTAISEFPRVDDTENDDNLSHQEEVAGQIPGR